MSHLTPKNADEIADFINSAIADKVPLEVIGGGTKRKLGSPHSAGQVLDTSAISGIVSYAPEELVMTVQAATPMAEIQAALDEKKQVLAFEPPDISALFQDPPPNNPCTIAGAIMCNLSGSRRPFAGAARDFLLGFSGVSGRGEKFKAGGKVVKNVTGFDLSKLITGSYGTLAVVDEMTLKTHPASEFCHSWALPCEDMQTARDIMERAINAAFPPTGAAYLPNGANGNSVILRFEGGAAPLQAAKTHLQTLSDGFHLLCEGAESQTLWQKIGSANMFADAGGDDYLWKISLPPSESPAFVGGIQVGESYFADWGGGLIWLQTTTAERHAEIRSDAERLGGYAHLIRCPDACEVPRFHPRPDAELKILQNIKSAFDPHGILNPHRMGF